MAWMAVTGDSRDDKWVTNWVVKYPLGGSTKATLAQQITHKDLLNFFGVCTPKNGGLNAQGNTHKIGQAQIDTVPVG
jgi:hypothetical protein